MNRGKRSYKRREILSNPGVQMKIIGVFFSLALLYALTNFFVGTHTLRAVSTRLLELPLSNATRYDLTVIIDQQTQVLSTQLVLLTVFSMATLLLGGTYLSHKIGGPIYQLNKYCRDVAEGRATIRKITFRKFDFFADLADSFNAFQRHHGLFREEKEVEGRDASDPDS